MRVFEVSRASVRLDGQTVLDGVDLQVSAGRLVAVTGVSGSGKTTLLDMLFGFIMPDSGRVTYYGEPVTKPLVGRVAYLIAEPERYFFETTVLEEVLNAVSFTQIDDTEKAAREALIQAGLSEDYFYRDPLNLSRGEKRKVALAAVFASGADTFLLDEPFSGLDYTSTIEIAMAIHNLLSQGKTFICTLHDPEPVFFLKPELYLLAGRRLLPVNLDRPREAVELYREHRLKPPERLEIAAARPDLPVCTGETEFIRRFVAGMSTG